MDRGLQVVDTLYLIKVIVLIDYIMQIFGGVNQSTSQPVNLKIWKMVRMPIRVATET